MINKKLKAFIINTLRRASFRHKPRGEAKKRYKVEVGEYGTGRKKYGYECSKCEQTFKSSEIKMDHRFAVVCPIDGWQNFDVYIERLFCSEENFKSLCSPCHDVKTAQERDFRKRAKNLKAENKSLKKLKKEYKEFLDEY